uniref:Uncharacterized protein n=1 Tax=Arundo donax TaxID=35708 RepID=A0A0A9CEZ3_ARUDO
MRARGRQQPGRRRGEPRTTVDPKPAAELKAPFTASQLLPPPSSASTSTTAAWQLGSNRPTR